MMTGGSASRPTSERAGLPLTSMLGVWQGKADVATLERKNRDEPE